ncbi:MAG: 3'(2'),5'-bisphosphate nucleotidase CysQ [Actinomycetota bacterium]|nr:3'(2'),5'-bisphosphate nucleotidase CysQ [Actinomycetota bacterium]
MTPAAASSSDVRLAASLAQQAGQLLLSLRERQGAPTGRELGAHGDADSNAFLLRELAAARPDDAVLSEESADSPARLSAERVWIIDPLDGTREYGLPGRSDWAVHVALFRAHDGIIAAAVAQPALDALYTSDDVAAGDVAAGSLLRRRPLILVSDSRPPVFAEQVAAAVGADLAPMGSAGAKAMAVVRGQADAYLHAGGQWEWDSAAPVGVARAAGLHASRIDGSELLYNQPYPYLPDLLVCRAELAQLLLTAIAAASWG